MRKRKTKDSNNMILFSNWLGGSHISGIYVLKCVTMLIVMSVFVENVNGLDVVEKPLIVENNTLPSPTFTPLENISNTSRSLEISVTHHATVRDNALDTTTISNYDSMEEEDLSGEVNEEVKTTVVRTTTEQISLDKSNSTTKTVETSRSSKALNTDEIYVTPSLVPIVESTSRPSSSTPLRQRSYDISVNKTNDIYPDLNLRANKNAGDSSSGLNGADVLAFANVEESSTKTSTPANKTTDHSMNTSNNNTLKALTDWTHIIKTMESSTENDNEVTSMLNESRTDIIPKLKSTTPSTVPAFSPLPSTITTIRIKEAPTKSSPIPLTTTNVMFTTSEKPATVFNKDVLTIGEVYRKKSESMATVGPSNRIDVYEYYRTETPPSTTTLPTTSTEEASTTTTNNWMTTNVDKRNTDIELIETSIPSTTTDTPQLSTIVSRRQNYRFTTLSPIATDFFTTRPSGQETTTSIQTTNEESTTEQPQSTTLFTTSSKVWAPTTLRSTVISTFQEPTQQSTVDSFLSSSSTQEVVHSTDIVTKIPKTISHVITTQTVVTDNDNIWVVTDENTTPVSSTTPFSSTTSTPTESSTMSEEIASTEAPGPDVAAIVVISLSVVGVVAFLLLMGFLFIIRKRQNQTKYANRCRPVGLDAYSLDNVSVYNSVRRKGNNLRLSKRSYGNSGFEDPNLQSHVLSVSDLATFVQNKYAIYDEYKDIPVITSRIEEMLYGCEDKNRYSNVIPLPETRVHLQRQNDDEKTEYINANYVKGPQDTTNYYIATQAPLDNTIHDFWRLVWEQQCKVIIMATDLSENGVEKCAQYLPSSVVLDNVQTYGHFQITLKSREVKEKYALSTIHIKHLETKSYREIVHFWYSWPETGVPSDETSLIAMLLEARSYSRLSLPEQRSTDNELESLNINNNRDIESGTNETNGKIATSTLDKTRSLQRTQTPIIVHCSPGTSRTGTIIACDIVLRTLEIPPRQIDIPKIVYTVRRGRANAVQTKQQYEFIYKVAHVYATKLNGPSID